MQHCRSGKLDGKSGGAQTANPVRTVSWREPCQVDLSQYAYDTKGDALFSDKVISRFIAMSALADCFLVSAKGTFYPVHKVKLLEQSTVLG